VGPNPPPPPLEGWQSLVYCARFESGAGNTHGGSNPSPSAATPMECEPDRRARPPLEAGGWPNGHEGQVLRTPLNTCPRRLSGQDTSLSS
jgi:hypothetical protein